VESGVNAGALGASTAALLIDADNLSPEGMDAALRELTGRGLRLTVLRAYGSPETLAAAKEFLQRHAARVVVNQGRGTTDAALVVDAMDLLHQGGLPPTVAIGSSDADFAPLAVRLREAGRQVLCYAQAHKADLDALRRVYQEVVPLQEKGRAAPAPSARSRAPSARKPATKAAAPRPAPARAPAAPPLREAVLAVLEAVPGFLEGEALNLNSVVKMLRDAGLMAKSAGASTFFRKLELPLELMPARQPNKLRLRAQDLAA